MIKQEENDKNINNHNNIIPWNSKEFPVSINNIRYNQDNSLLTLATSRGYKIFSTQDLVQVHEETNIIRDLGDLDIVMTYYCSSLVFFTPTKNNNNFTTKDLILFDDYAQNQISSFKSKKEKITNFYVGKYALFIVLETSMIIVELISFKIIYIINNIYSEQKLCSFNSYGFVAFIKKNEKYKVYIKVLNIENNKISSIRNRCINSNFEYIQSLKLSPSGQFIALSSIFGNKLHIYYTENLILRECFYLGNEINNIAKMSFPGIEEGFLIFQINEKKFRIYKLSNILEGNFNCNCYKYDNEDLVKNVIKNKENEGKFFNYIKTQFFNYYFSSPLDNKISKSLISFEVKEGILFLDFVENNKYETNNVDNFTKEIVIINRKGFYYKFLFNNNQILNENNQENNLILKDSFQWV